MILKKFIEFKDEMKKKIRESMMGSVKDHLRSLDINPIDVMKNLQEISMEFVDNGFNFRCDLNMTSRNGFKIFLIFHVSEKDIIEDKLLISDELQDKVIDSMMTDGTKFSYNISFKCEDGHDLIEEFIIPFFNRIEKEYRVKFHKIDFGDSIFPKKIEDLRKIKGVKNILYIEFELF